MAFNPLHLFTSSGVMNATGYGEAPAIHTYISDDLIADIATPGYFPDFFGLSPENVRPNDIIFIHASDLRTILLVFLTAPVILANYVDFPTNIVTETATTESQEAAGPWAVNPAFIIDINQMGHECLLTIPSVSDASIGAAMITFVAAVIPSAFPLYEITTPIWIQDNSIDEVGIFKMDTSSVVTITRANAVPFTASGDAGFLSTPIKYKTI